MKYTLFQRLEVVNYGERFDGVVGEVERINNYQDEPVYTIKYEGSNNKGIFPESNLRPVK